MIWEQEIYSQGRQLNRYPFDSVVSFLYRYRRGPGASLVEVGCGAGNNLWFAAREGFKVAGLDGSPSAIEYAHQRLKAEGLEGDLRVGDFAQLPWQDNTFDLALDRGALTNVPWPVLQQAVAEVRRILRPGGRFHLNPYSDRHSSFASGTTDEHGMSQDIQVGLTGMGGIRFTSRREVDELCRGWNVLSLQHVEKVECREPAQTVHAEWLVILEKP